MADPQTLAAVFNASFSPDPNVRIAAELELRKLETAEGMTGVVLQLVASEGVEKAIRQAAAIYLKNRIRRSWDDSPSVSRSGTDLPSNATRPPAPLSPTDRQALKQNFLHVLVTSPPILQAQLKTALLVMVRCDFPDHWPGLAENVAAAVSQPYNAHTEGALLVLGVILTQSRFAGKDKRVVPDAIVVQTFPYLVKLCSDQLAATPQDQAPDHVGRLLHLTFKCYRYTIHRELSAHQMSDASIVPWGTLFLQVVNRTIPESAQAADEEERQRAPWWKAKKWAYCLLNTLYARYGSPTQLAKNNVADYGAFAERFETSFAPEIFKAYLRQVELLVNGQAWLSQRCVRNIIDFFTECIKPKAMWKLIKPHIDTLLDRFLFPIFCLTDDEISDFNDDPKEFVRAHQAEAMLEYFHMPITSGILFLGDIVKHRKTAMLPILTFVNNVVSAYPSQRSPKEKDAALRMISCIAEHIVKSKEYGQHMEGFIVRFVVPEFASPVGYLRARACDVIDKFEENDMTWNDTDALTRMLEGCLHLLVDPELPVRVAAALALPELSRYEQVRSILAPNIGRVMQDVLAAANEVELDRMSTATRSLFTIFSSELMPFAVQLSAQLGNTYLRLVREAIDLRSKGGDDDDFAEGPSEDKALAALGMLKSIQGLLEAVEELPDHLAQIEAQVIPLLAFTMENEMAELFDEIFEIVDTITFFQKKISPPLWQIFELTHKIFKGPGIDYVEEMLPSLDNFISYGSAYLSQHPTYIQMLLDIFETTMTSPHLGAEERCIACKLAESMLLNLRGAIDPLIPAFLVHALDILFRTNTSSEPIISARVYLHALELVLDCLYYNPLLTLHHLETLPSSASARPSFAGRDAFAGIVERWLKHIEKLSRVHDRKLGIMAVVALLESLAQAPSVGTHAAGLMQAALSLFAGLPRAIKERAEAETTALEDDDEEADGVDADDAEDGGEFVDEDGDVVSDGELDEEAIQALLRDKMFRNMVGQPIANGDGDDEEYEDEDDDGISEAWSEEVLFTSPLDDVDTYVRFATVLSNLQASFPNLASQFSPQQQEQLSDVMATAQAGGEAAVKAKAAEALKAEGAKKSLTNGHA